MQSSNHIIFTKLMPCLVLALLLVNFLSACDSDISDLEDTSDTIPINTIIPGQTQSPSTSSSNIEMIKIMVIEDLALRLSISTSKIDLLSIEEVQWPNAGLGCPSPILDYGDVIVPGYIIILIADKVTFYYHTDQNNQFILCDGQSQPQFPFIPLTPGEIQDGIPWMPVDPVD